MENPDSSLTNNLPGWYLDSSQKNQERWWDGSNWTESTAELPSSVHNLAEVFVVREPRVRLILATIFSLLMVALGVYVRSDDSLRGAFLILVGVGVAVVGSVRSVKVGVLTADQTGFSENVWPRKPRKFRWSDVSGFHVRTMRVGMAPEQRFVYVDLSVMPDDIYSAVERTVAPGFLGSGERELCLQGTYSMPVEQLARKLNTMLRAHHRS